MAVPFAGMHRIVGTIAARLDDDVSLKALAARAGLSPFHLQRVFSSKVGETPKQLALRLRLGRAAVLLLTTRDSVLDVALACGFQSHEVFTRAFRRRFGITPRAYRERGFAQNVDIGQAKEHGAVAIEIAPCVGLYHMGHEREDDRMSYSISKTTLAPQQLLVIRRTVNRSDIASTIAQELPKIFAFSLQHGIALVPGHPVTRYVQATYGSVTMEPGIRVAPGAQMPKTEGEVELITLPGGSAAMTTHMGDYKNLHDAYAALERWMESGGHKSTGAPWEEYVTDPGEVPDVKNWRTDVFWPLAE
jgi:AraC-like DNA-binding protein/effector-binding domain-containing protein